MIFLVDDDTKILKITADSSEAVNSYFISKKKHTRYLVNIYNINRFDINDNVMYCYVMDRVYSLYSYYDMKEIGIANDILNSINENIEELNNEKDLNVEQLIYDVCEEIDNGMFTDNNNNIEFQLIFAKKFLRKLSYSLKEALKLGIHITDLNAENVGVNDTGDLILYDFGYGHNLTPDKKKMIMSNIKNI